MSENNITTIGDLSPLIHLTELRIDKNHLTELPESLGSLVQLTTLSARYIRDPILQFHTTFSPSHDKLIIGECVTSLRENDLKALPSSINTLTNLQMLYVQVNQLTTFPTISSLSRLVSLNVASNCISTIQDPNEITAYHWENLTDLVLGDNSIKRIHTFLHCTYFNRYS